MPARDLDEKRVIGWREWVGLPDLGIAEIKVKVDTGARSSALHVVELRIEERDGRRVACFEVHPRQRDTKGTVAVEVDVLEHRKVRSSSGKATLRPVIVTSAVLMGERWPIELTLTNRDEMGFRMLLGREAVRGRFLVDPGRSFLSGDRWKKGPRKQRAAP